MVLSILVYFDIWNSELRPIFILLQRLPLSWLKLTRQLRCVIYFLSLIFLELVTNYILNVAITWAERWPTELLTIIVALILRWRAFLIILMHLWLKQIPWDILRSVLKAISRSTMKVILLKTTHIPKLWDIGTLVCRALICIFLIVWILIGTFPHSWNEAIQIKHSFSICIIYILGLRVRILIICILVIVKASGTLLSLVILFFIEVKSIVSDIIVYILIELRRVLIVTCVFFCVIQVIQLIISIRNTSNS